MAATEKQKAALTKARASKKLKNLKGLGAIETALNGVVSFKDTTNDLMQTAGVVVGFIGGQMIKKKFGTDQEGMKKYMSVLINSGAGFGLMSLDGKMLAGFKPVVAGIGQGMLASGIVTGFEVVTGKDILKGLEGVSVESLLGFSDDSDDLSDEMNEIQSEFYPIGDPMELDVTQEYDPDLPELRDTDVLPLSGREEEVEEYVETFESKDDDEEDEELDEESENY